MAVDVIISVDEKADFADVITRLEDAGLVVRQTLDAASVVVGTAAEAALATLRQIPGVLAVEPERDIAMAPSGSNLP